MLRFPDGMDGLYDNLITTLSRIVAPLPGSWTIGDYLTHRYNPELGIGRVTAVDTRTVSVSFPRSGTTLRLARGTDALRPVDLSPGRPVRITASREETTIADRMADGRLVLANGDVEPADALWPMELEGALFERLAIGEVDSVRDFAIRLRILQLLELREANGLGSFLGGRVRLFPHQLYVAEKASRVDPVRWLLADEVGLGKTIEAALILNRLVHTGRVERCLVVAPDALTVQWLGELWRKYHQVFTLLDAPRLADVARDFGDDVNPFDVHRRAVIALETLVQRPELTEQAARAGIDLLVVDEAQRLRRPPGHPGDERWRAVAPIAARGRHVLLLSATPLEDDAHGFFRLLQLLRPDEFPEDVSFDTRLASGVPLPPGVSSTRRVDIGGLPPRVGIPIELPAGESAAPAERRTVEALVRAMPAPNIVAWRRKVDRVRRALASGAALAAVLGPDERPLRERVEQMDATDPRLAWLLAQAPRWREAREKTLIFVAHRETLEMLRTALSHRAQIASGVFHEELSPARRDTEVARFREAEGPSILVSTECGGEGRNFEFCRRLVLFDLPWTPSLVEQRIGRLDRIGRRIPVDVVYFRPPDGIGRDVVRLFEALGVFREPLAGLEPQLAHVEAALDALALDPAASMSDTSLDTLLEEARAARTRIREAAYHELHREPYRADMADAILARVPPDLDALNETVIVAACERLGFSVERQRGRRAVSFELGSGAVVDSLPGVPGGSTFVGTFDREEAVERETLDFFASGHPLVEGVFAHIDDSPFGRAVRCEVLLGGSASRNPPSSTGRGEGLVAVYKHTGGFEVVAIDAQGRSRPDWAEAIRTRRTLKFRRPGDDLDVDWPALVARLMPRFDASRRPYAVAAIVVR
jgi:ATP-dependent helicase HepA